MIARNVALTIAGALVVVGTVMAFTLGGLGDDTSALRHPTMTKDQAYAQDEALAADIVNHLPVKPVLGSPVHSEHECHHGMSDYSDGRLSVGTYYTLVGIPSGHTDDSVKAIRDYLTNKHYHVAVDEANMLTMESPFDEQTEVTSNDSGRVSLTQWLGTVWPVQLYVSSPCIWTDGTSGHSADPQ